ncbi:nostrin isoform X3 [Loxodonta africana]|uniref:nostrin isoform X3 n=1 Tax=Loxodonta africana TaxID=9785 RepID=UPI000C8114F4|nr:nostrin isoform X3 [Loxodonta africana]
MRDPLTDCSYNKVYKNLKEFSQNGENFCKQITSVLQQRANLETSYAKGLQKLAIKLSKVLQSTKRNCLSIAWTWASEGMKSAADLHQKLGKAIQLEAIKPTHQVLSMQEKKRKALDNEVEKAANLVINNWNQQIKAKKKLMVSTKKHEALFHLVESSKQSVTKKEKQKLLNKLKKSTENLAKEEENYYQKNMAGYSTRLKWESTLENCYQSFLELEKERIQLLCNNLNQYNQHISAFGQTLTMCHTQINCAISKVDAEKDIQSLMEEAAISTTEKKSEFLLIDYFEEDPNNSMDKERRKSSIKSKLLRLQRDIEKASKDKEGLEQMLNAYSSNSSFSDGKNQKDTAALMDEEQTHSYVKISRPFMMKRLENIVSKASSGGQNNPSSSSYLASDVPQLSNGLCKALYSFQARQEDELNLEKGDIVAIHEKKGEGWWFGSLNGKEGHFPAAYVEELPSNTGNAAT